MAIDILTTDHVFPNTVYILAPGYEGRKQYDRISDDAFVITVNKGFQIPNVHKNLWLAEDVGLLSFQPWFADAVRGVIAERNELMAPETTVVIDSGKMFTLFPDARYVYNSTPSYLNFGRNIGDGTGPYEMIPGCLRGRATISSKAMQLAVKKGAKRIILCGVDMQGDKYFDGSITKSGHISGGVAQGNWYFVPHFNKLVERLTMKGIDVVSLSPTALSVEVI